MTKKKEQFILKHGEQAVKVHPSFIGWVCLEDFARGFPSELPTNPNLPRQLQELLAFYNRGRSPFLLPRTG